MTSLLLSFRYTILLSFGYGCTSSGSRRKGRSGLSGYSLVPYWWRIVASPPLFIRHAKMTLKGQLEYPQISISKCHIELPGRRSERKLTESQAGRSSPAWIRSSGLAEVAAVSQSSNLWEFSLANGPSSDVNQVNFPFVRSDGRRICLNSSNMNHSLVDEDKEAYREKHDIRSHGLHQIPTSFT